MNTLGEEAIAEAGTSSAVSCGCKSRSSTERGNTWLFIKERTC